MSVYFWVGLGSAYTVVAFAIATGRRWLGRAGIALGVLVALIEEFNVW